MEAKTRSLCPTMNSQNIPAGRLYHDLAGLMRLITPPKDYAAEAAHWRAVLREKLGPGRHPLLELGVGGGHNLSHLAGDFAATAVDLSPAMLAQCRQLNPGVELIAGDMRTLRLGRTFAAVLIHDAIGHMLTETDLLAAFRTAAAHLLPGGIFITAADRYSEDFHSPETDTRTHSDGQQTVTCFEYTHAPDPAGTRLEVLLTCLIRTETGVRIEHDRLELGLFPRATWLRRLDEAGFAVETRSFRLPDWPRPYELLVGTRR
jgi:SAM-dependent methyltransferase